MTEAQKVKLQEAWDKRQKLRNEADKLYVEENRLHAVKTKINNLTAKNPNYHIEVNKLRNEADIIWRNAVIAYANSLDDPDAVHYEWDLAGCIIDGVRFEGRILQFLNGLCRLGN